MKSFIQILRRIRGPKAPVNMWRSSLVLIDGRDKRHLHALETLDAAADSAEVLANSMASYATDRLSSGGVASVNQRVLVASDYIVPEDPASMESLLADLGRSVYKPESGNNKNEGIDLAKGRSGYCNGVYKGVVARREDNGRYQFYLAIAGDMSTEGGPSGLLYCNIDNVGHLSLPDAEGVDEGASSNIYGQDVLLVDSLHACIE